MASTVAVDDGWAFSSSIMATKLGLEEKKTPSALRSNNHFEISLTLNAAMVERSLYC